MVKIAFLKAGEDDPSVEIDLPFVPEMTDRVKIGRDLYEVCSRTWTQPKRTNEWVCVVGLSRA